MCPQTWGHRVSLTGCLPSRVLRGEATLKHLQSQEGLSGDKTSF